MVRFVTFFTCLASIGLALALSGCNKAQKPNTPVSADKDGQKAGGDHVHKHGEGHAHKPAAHNGIIFAIGADSYHGEAVFEKDGALRLYTLDADEEKIDVEAVPVEGFVDTSR